MSGSHLITSLADKRSFVLHGTIIDSEGDEVGSKEVNFQKVYFCPAKLNLFLKLLDIRDDGYRNLQSLMVSIDLFDEISAVLSQKFSVKFRGEFGHLVDENHNLFVKIFNFFATEFRLNHALKLDVVKNIPVGGGLGGGSSNAAKFMQILNQIFGLNLNKTCLQEIALKFGSDIPFFLEEQPAFIFGRGEVVRPFSGNNQYSSLGSNKEFDLINRSKSKSFSPKQGFWPQILVINPKIPLQTALVFSRVKSDNFGSEISAEKLFNSSIEELLLGLPNDLTNAAISELPIIGQILQEIVSCGALIAKMSGSGATCFGVFESAQELSQAKLFFETHYPEFFISVNRVLKLL